MSETLPPPIWAHRNPPEREPVSEAAIVNAALGLLDERGVDGLTMRAVAERMGVTPPTVYWHVQNKEGLLDRLYDRLCAEVPAPPADQPWDQRLRYLAHSIRAVLGAHRDAARIAIGRFALGPHGLRATETALAALTDAGLDDEQAAHAAYLLFGYVTSFCYQQTIIPARTPTGDRTEALGRVGEYLQSLPAKQYPHLVRSAEALARPGLDQRFAFGLDLLLWGLASQPARPAIGTARDSRLEPSHCKNDGATTSAAP